MTFPLAEYACLPLKPAAKQPLGPWKRWQYERADAGQVAAWRRELFNVGIVYGSASGVVVLDFD